MSCNRFRLQLSSAEIRQFARKYIIDESEISALAAGKRIANGDFRRSNLSAIFEWKTRGRGRSRIQKNSDAEISEALRIASTCKSEKIAMAVLLGLDGIGVPVASSILAAIDPEKYTVIDFRALEALGTNSLNRSISYYVEYLSCCRELATRHKASLRELDRSMWQWSKDRGGKQAPKNRRAE